MGSGGGVLPDRRRGLRRWQGVVGMGYDVSTARARLRRSYRRCCHRSLSSLQRRRGADEADWSDGLSPFYQLAARVARGRRSGQRGGPSLLRSSYRRVARSADYALCHALSLGFSTRALLSRWLVKPAEPGVVCRVHRGDRRQALRPGKALDDAQRAAVFHWFELAGGHPCAR